MKKTWINVFVDYYDPNQYYVSKTYGTKTEALTGVRNSMKDRYVATIDLSLLLFPKKKKKIVSKTVKINKPVFIQQEINYLKRLRKTMYNTGVDYDHCIKIDKRIQSLKK